VSAGAGVVQLLLLYEESTAGLIRIITQKW
jgi:hypothetical protein